MQRSHRTNPKKHTCTRRKNGRERERERRREGGLTHGRQRRPRLRGFALSVFSLCNEFLLRPKNQDNMSHTHARACHTHTHRLPLSLSLSLSLSLFSSLLFSSLLAHLPKRAKEGKSCHCTMSCRTRPSQVCQLHPLVPSFAPNKQTTNNKQQTEPNNNSQGSLHLPPPFLLPPSSPPRTHAHAHTHTRTPNKQARTQPLLG